jgi:hypothetical protein
VNTHTLFNPTNKFRSVTAMTAKPTLTLSPATLHMSSHTGEDGIVLEIANKSGDAAVIFKCKTTSPQRYIVRNRQGVIAPNGSTKVQIQLQRGVVLTGSDDSDIFLVESRYLSQGEVDQATDKTTDFNELLKSKGKSAISKQQVLCELTIGPDQRPGADKGLKGAAQSEASAHTQPTSVRSGQSGSGRSEHAAATAAAAAAQDPLVRRDAAAAANSTQQPPSQQQVSQRAKPADPLTRQSPAVAGASPRPAQAKKDTTAQTKPTPWALVGGVVAVVAAGGFFFSGPAAAGPVAKTTGGGAEPVATK